MIKKFISKTKGLEIYSHYFNDMIRQREHTLSEKEEELLAMAGELYRSPENIYDALTMTDLEFPKVVNEEGDSVRLTIGRYDLFLLSEDPDMRRRAELARNKAYDKIINGKKYNEDKSAAAKNRAADLWVIGKQNE